MLPTGMRAVVQHGPQEMKVEELPLPQPAHGQILVRVRANGICGSDLHFWKHAVYGSGVVLGHEICGEVAALGDGVRDIEVGALGAIHSGGSCGVCARCSSGLAYYCQDGQGLGTGRGNGGYAEYIVATAASFIPVPAGSDPAVVSFSEPIANGLRCLNYPEVAQAKSALIIGAGPIGLSCLAAAKRAGVARIWVVEGRARRAAAALSLGAERVLDPHDDVAARVRHEFPFGVELAVEAVGHPDTIRTALKLARPRATVIVMGVCLEPVELRPVQWMLKELTIRSSLGCDRDDQQAAVDMLRRGAIDPAPLITRRIGIEEVPETLRQLAAGADEIKVVLEHA
jgi:2-desacetyl-2-hydroxyethyl bacteriochlorophyllide A dehydrogenase